MNENKKIYIVLGVVIAFIVAIIGYSIYVKKISEEIYNNFSENLNSSEEKIVFIGRKSCSWCQLFQPVFDYFVSKFDFNYQYVDTEKLLDDDFYKIIGDLKIEADDFGTPLVVFVKDGKVTEEINGYVDEKVLLQILQEHDYIPEEETNVLTYLNLDSLKKVFNSKEKSVVVIGKTSCSYCIMQKPVLMEVVDETSILINYLNYNEIEEQEELLEFLEQFEPFQGKWGTPLTLLVEDGKIIDVLNGYADKTNYLKFLKKNNLIEK